MQLINDATKRDARHLAYLVNLAGEGMPFYYWQTLCAPGQQVIDLGTNHAERESGDFSYRNARIYHHQGEVAGSLIAFRLDDPYDTGDLEDEPAYIRPLIELEAKAPGCWYINVLAVYEPFRRKGIASALMRDCFIRGRTVGAKSVCLITHSTNQPAIDFYHHWGFHTLDEKPAIIIPHIIEGGSWQLLGRKL